MAVINIASGKTISKTAKQVKDALLHGDDYVGVDGGPVETLAIQLAANQALELAGKTSHFSNLTLSVKGSAGNDIFTGTDLAETVLGLAGNDNLSGNGGDDALNGGAGSDRLDGGSGNDVLTGDVGNDVLMAGTGNDVLDGGAGNDVMFGGAGNDTYIVDAVADKISEISGEGTDLVKSSISYKLGSNLENLTLTGAATINGTGNGLDNVIIGNAKANVLTGGAGNDTLDGGLGNDTLVGGTGDDTYVLDNAADQVVEFSAQGTDTIQASFSYLLAGNLENLTLTGNADINGDGNDANNIIVGNAGSNVLDGGDGNDELAGGDGDDILLGGDGNDILDGGVGADILSGGEGNNTYIADAEDIVIGGTGLDTVESDESIVLGSGVENLTLTGANDVNGTGNELNNVMIGNSGNNVLDGGAGDDELAGGDGDDTFVAGEGADVMNGESGSDTFVISSELAISLIIDGGTDDAGTDATVNPVYYNAAHTSISTVNSTLGTPNSTDIIQFTQSGDFSNIEFTNVEQIHLDSGVEITLSSEQLDAAIGSLDLGATNPGLHFYGVAGGAEESVTVVVDYADVTFTPAGTVVGGMPTTYNMGDFQLDDASIGDLFHNVSHHDDFNTNSTVDSYARADGSNSNDYGIGSKGVDNVTLRLGDDTYYGNEGNDLLIGHQGNDYLDGGAGNDTFNITGFETSVFGISGKADDGHKEWNATGVAHDVIVGGEGVDTLRITAGAVDTTAGLVELNDGNFMGMERVEIGTTVGRLNVEDSALQLLHDHYYLKAGTTESATAKTGGVDGGTSVTPNFNYVSVDASGITDADNDSTTGGLTFVGNGNINTFIGTANDDTFIGNGGNDVLTGSLGGDTFQFGNVHTMTVTGAATTVQTYTDVASNLTGIDTITDFVSGTDHLVLDNDFFASFVATGVMDSANFVQGAGAVALDADDYLVFDTSTHALYYDADGSGAGVAVQFATLTGVASLAAADFSIV